MGRPKLDHPKIARVVLRVQPNEHAAWKRAASRAGVSLSEWIRRLVNAASGHMPKDPK